MNFRDYVAEDPFSTCLERAVAETAHSIGEWHNNAARAAWRQFTPAERADLADYWAAFRENEDWGRAVRSSWERKLLWCGGQAAWRRETDAEYRRRTAPLKWRPAGDRFEYIGDRNLRKAA